MGIQNAFDPIAPEDLGPPVFTTVQASLFNRLRSTRGKNAGNLAWLLVRLAQPDHREHDDACTLILAQPLADLTALLSVVSGARAGAKRVAARDMLAAIADALETARAGAHTREKSKKPSKV